MSFEEQFTDLNVDAINMFLRNRQEENLWLDFKSVQNSDLSHRDDRKNLAKALSGFANSSGGIIVWGVDARKNKEGIDCATDKKEIDDVNRFVSKLNALTGEAVSPIADGVRHRKIVTEPPKGFAVTLVPESDSGPHMAKLGEDRYYKRSGDSFYKMEHFDLEDMFGRRRKPKLTLKLTPENTAHTVGNQVRLRLLMSVCNEGRGSAKSTFLAVYRPDEIKACPYGVDGNGNHGLTPVFNSQGNRILQFQASREVVIHPGLSRDVTKLEKDIWPNGDITDIAIVYDIVADGIALRQDTSVITADEIRNHFLKLGVNL